MRGLVAFFGGGFWMRRRFSFAGFVLVFGFVFIRFLPCGFHPRIPVALLPLLPLFVSLSRLFVHAGVSHRTSKLDATELKAREIVAARFARCPLHRVWVRGSIFRAGVIYDAPHSRPLSTGVLPPRGSLDNQSLRDQLGDSRADR
jgi:hypothetical protein